MMVIGITSKGERKKFIVDNIGFLNCSYKDLVSLDIPDGVKYLWCYNNLLKELKIPSSVEYLECENNKISELNIPITLKKLCCDRHIKGLDKKDCKCEITLV